MLQCKWLGLAVAVLFCIGGSAQSAMIPYYNAVMADNPIVYYQLDEAASATTAVNDGSAASADGTYSYVTLGQASAFAGLGTSGAYNGTWGAGGSMLTVPSGVTEMNVGAGDFSVELWYVTEQETRSDLFANKDDGNPQKSFAIISNLAGGTACVYETGGSAHVTKPSAADEVWHHLVVTRTSGAYAMYVDTVKTDLTDLGSSVLNFDSTWSGQKTVGLNWNDDGPTQTLLGNVDEFAYYGAALSQDRVTAHYDAAAIIPEPSTLALLATGLIGLLCYAWRKRK